MANSEHLAKLNQGVEVWNEWRNKHPDTEIDLSHAELFQTTLFEANLAGANLTGANLYGTNLRWANLGGADLDGADLNGSNLCRATLSSANLRGADLSRSDIRNADLTWANLSLTDFHDANLNAANLSWADLTNADLSNANLEGATLIGASLVRANLSGTILRRANLTKANLGAANLKKANLKKAELDKAILQEADLSKADLSEAKLTEAVLLGANLSGTNLAEADLTMSDLRKANLTSASLQYARFDQANLTDATLWETQRAHWSIKGILCETAYWDQNSKIPDHYSPGEFERLYSDHTRIELFYPGGMTTFELNTLPALLHYLTATHPGTGIRLKSMEESGGGAKITLSVDESDPDTLADIRTEATRSQTAQITLRDDEITRLKIQKQLLLEEIFPRMLAAAPQVHFAGEANNVAIAIGGSTITAHQTHNDTKAILALLNQIMSHRAELALPSANETQLDDAVQSVRSELNKPEPKASVVAAGMNIIKEIATKVVESAAEKALTDNWHPMLNQLTSLIHHWV